MCNEIKKQGYPKNGLIYNVPPAMVKVPSTTRMKKKVLVV
jgi:hypothetical protein